MVKNIKLKNVDQHGLGLGIDTKLIFSYSKFGIINDENKRIADDMTNKLSYYFENVR